MTVAPEVISRPEERELALHTVPRGEEIGTASLHVPLPIAHPKNARHLLVPRLLTIRHEIVVNDGSAPCSGAMPMVETRKPFGAFLALAILLAVWDLSSSCPASEPMVSLTVPAPLLRFAQVGRAEEPRAAGRVAMPEFPKPPADIPPEDPTPYARWSRGPSQSPDYFPIAVWLQNPKNAKAFKELGINLYIGLWRGPTEEQLQLLREAGMPVICSLNEVARKHLDDPIIVGWMHGDEPDNAQPRRDGKPGWGPPIPPEEIIAEYKRMKAEDPTRPIFLNLGQGVAWDRWYGRGVRSNHPEDYPLYVQGADIVSFDIYPVVHTHPDVKGQLWYVAYGVARLRHWTNYQKIVWNCIECSRISNTEVKPTAEQIRAEVWMSIIHGSRGIVYFVHQFKPTFIEASLLVDEELKAGVAQINRQIHELAPVINSPTLHGAVAVTTEPADVPVAVMVKKKDGALYIFAVAMQDRPVKASFRLPPSVAAKLAEVLGENRSVPVESGQFQDAFGPYAVHLYRLALDQ
ncbi:MAG: hypothetical protein NZ899_05540 [Thermoguttaceae bacterium]|nr:hypothetical protein [Thermoguttaceae bacterium]MDW8079403.1 hypothetical protein [Thermoguttaceae bacterium]